MKKLRRVLCIVFHYLVIIVVVTPLCIVGGIVMGLVEMWQELRDDWRFVPSYVDNVLAERDLSKRNETTEV